MRLICPNCATQYEVDASAIPPEGRDVQCGTCNKTWFQGPAVPIADVTDGGIADQADNLESEADDASVGDVQANTATKPSAESSEDVVAEVARTVIEETERDASEPVHTSLEDPDAAAAAIEAWAIRGAEASTRERVISPGDNDDDSSPAAVEEVRIAEPDVEETQVDETGSEAVDDDAGQLVESQGAADAVDDAMTSFDDGTAVAVTADDETSDGDEQAEKDVGDDGTPEPVGLSSSPEGDLARRLKERVAKAARERAKAPPETADTGAVLAATNAAVATAAAQDIDPLPVGEDAPPRRTERPKRMEDISRRRPLIPPATPEPRRSGFATGFIVVVLIFAVLVSTYVLRGQLAALIPAAAPVLDAYASAIDGARSGIQGVVSNFSGSEGTEN